MDFLCACVRIPKCGSTSLAMSLHSAFAGRRTFYLPHTLNLEGSLSIIQDLRFRRTTARNLITHYRTPSIAKVYDHISAFARDGDLISGGHIDFPSLRDNVRRRVKMITMFRDPVTRCRSEYDYCRQSFDSKSRLSRLDSTIKHRIAGRQDFDGYLDFMLERNSVYGDVAARYVGWNGCENLDAFFARDVFHSGVLEQSRAFVRGLSEKMGIGLEFPHENRTRTKAADAVTRSQRARIEALFPSDFALYEWQLSHCAEPARRATATRATAVTLAA